MADFALWATACETVFWPSGFLQAYKANRRSAVEDVVDADPVAARIRDIMAERTMWTGSASDLLRVLAPRPRVTHLGPAPRLAKIPELSPAGSDARRRLFARWESRLPSVVRGERGRASLG